MPSMDQTVEHPNNASDGRLEGRVFGFESGVVVLLFAAAVYLGCIVSPPALMDDVDAVQAQIARNMLTSGDWTIARLDGVPYLEKSPLIYWLIAGSLRIFGAHDWVTRIPVALATIFLAWLTYRYGRWAFGTRTGFYAGLAMATCVGLFLFTRIQIPDVMLTACVCGSFWAFQRSLEQEMGHNPWGLLLGACLGLGLLCKGLIAGGIPVAGYLTYLLVAR